MNDLPVSVLKEGLERRYKACIALIKDQYNLAIALFDYVQYMNDHPLIDYLFTEKLQADPRKIQEKVKRLEARAKKKLDKVYREIGAILVKNKIQDQTITDHLDNYQNFKKDGFFSSRGTVSALYDELRDVISRLFHRGHKQYVSKYVTLNSSTSVDQGETIKDFNIIDELEEIEQLKEKFKRQSDVSAWGAFDILFKSFRAVKASVDEKELDFLHDDSVFWASAFESLKRHGEERGLHLLLYDISGPVITRLHLALLDQLDLYEASDKTEEIKKRHGRVDQSVSEFLRQPLTLMVEEIKGRGYVRFGKRGHHIPIGKINSQPFMLMLVLTDQSEAYKTVDHVFDKAYKKAKTTESQALDHEQKVRKIEQIFKELLRSSEELQGGRLRLEFSPDNKRCVRLVVSNEVGKK